jgi:hypothetical protein
MASKVHLLYDDMIVNFVSGDEDLVLQPFPIAQLADARRSQRNTTIKSGHKSRRRDGRKL